jgi:hypothetical protein
MNLKRTHLSAAFTLIELMVSIFLLMLVMIGINSVFSSTSATIGVGQAQSEGIRDARAGHAVLTQDLSALASDGPSLIISMHQTAGFRSQQVRLGDPTPTLPLSWDRNADGVEAAAENVSVYDYGDRSFRHDTISFFGRGAFRRQTGGIRTPVMSADRQPLTANSTIREAWIWIGHLALANNNNGYVITPQAGNVPAVLTDPGAGTPDTNPNNFYATQWTVARQAILLSERNPDDPTTGQIGPGAQHYIQRNWMLSDPVTVGVTNLSPLAYFSPSTENTAITQLQTSRYDLASTSITGFATRLSAVIGANGPTTFNWWGDVADATVPNLFATRNFRFQANPFVVRPLTAATVSQQAPIFLKGCSSLIVEYAGNFVTQDPTTGAVTGATPDAEGTIDFVVTGTTAANRRRSIRWYGLPRSTDLNNDPVAPNVGVRITSASEAPTLPVGAPNQYFNDVVPLRDLLGGTPATFERVVPTGTPVSAPVYGVSPTNNAANESYICAWGPNDPNRPKLIRITFTLEDSLNRLPEGQTFEHVFTLP